MITVTVATPEGVDRPIERETIDLPTLVELRAYYAAQPEDFVFSNLYSASTCLIALPINERRGDRGVAIIPDSRRDYGEVGLTIGTGRGPRHLTGDLPADLNELAIAFDMFMVDDQGSRRPATRDVLLAWLDEQIAEGASDGDV